MNILSGVRQRSGLCTLKKDYFQLMGKWQKEDLKSQSRKVIKIYLKILSVPKTGRKTGNKQKDLESLAFRHETIRNRILVTFGEFKVSISHGRMSSCTQVERSTL